MKNPVLVRNFFIFSVILALCVAGLGYHTFLSAENIRAKDARVSQAQNVIIQTQELINDIIFLIGQQRNIVTGGDEDAADDYESAKVELSRQVVLLRDLTKDSPSQSSRMTEIEHTSLRFKDLLDEDLKLYRDSGNIPTLKDRQGMIAMRDSLFGLAQDILHEEYGKLEAREENVHISIRRYQVSLLIGGIVASLIILIFNWYLLQAQSKAMIAEEHLKESEERLRLAIRGSNDGIFDWDFKTHQIYWSPQYKAMLGYEDNEIKGDEDTFRSLLHPEDAEVFWDCFNNYINGSLSEFSCVYRMIHKSGRAVWINGRGKAIFDEEGQALRFIGAHTDISYLKEHERALKEEKDRAERANRAKSEFLAHMSHEIRTPLTAVSGIAEIFSQLDEGNQDEKHKKLVKTLRTSTETLKELITDILDFSKIESGEVELYNQNFPLGETFEQVVSIMASKALEKGITFSFDYDDVKKTSFYGDKLRLRQILLNLVGNAVKFTEEGFVSVKAFIRPVMDSHVLQIDIQDTGIGISEAALPIIFEKFRQADSSVSRRYGGTGLGLPISLSLAELMGGTIKVASIAGKGSTFTLLLPFFSPVREETGDVKEAEKIHKLNDRLKSAIGKKKRILIVEDYEGNIVVLSYLLGDLNCEYDIAKTGLEAVQTWKSNHYDLILMDIQMPEMDGLTATRTIRKMEDEQGLSRTPIVGLTAHALIADKEKCIDAGMDSYLSKPIVEADLKEMILGLLEEDGGKRPEKIVL